MIIGSIDKETCAVELQASHMLSTILASCQPNSHAKPWIGASPSEPVPGDCRVCPKSKAFSFRETVSSKEKAPERLKHVHCAL